MENEEWNHEVKSISEFLIKALWIVAGILIIIVPLVAYLLG
jgi:hypothetical protein